MKTGIQCCIRKPRKVKDAQQANHNREWEARGSSHPPFDKVQDPSLGNEAIHGGQVIHLHYPYRDNYPSVTPCSSTVTAPSAIHFSISSLGLEECRCRKPPRLAGPATVGCFFTDLHIPCFSLGSHAPSYNLLSFGCTQDWRS